MHNHVHSPQKKSPPIKNRDAQIELLVENIAAPSANFLENNIVKFIHLLRHLDIRISSAEAMDAIRAVELIDIMQPKEVKAALMSTLVKDSRSKNVFEQAFSVFFAPPEEGEQRKNKIAQMKAESAQQMQQAEADLVYKWIEQTPAGSSSGEEKINLTAEEKKVYTQLPEEAKQKLLEILKKPILKNPINKPQDLIEMMVRSSLNYWKRYLLNQNLDSAPVDVAPTGDEQMDQMLLDIVQQITSEEDIMYEDMKNIPDKDIPKVRALIWRLSRQLATRISRRYRQSKKHQKLDLRRTIRSNIKYGGSLYLLKHKTKRIEKPRLLLISDVSGSMAKYCSFVLQFIYGLASVIDEIETYIFSEDVEQISCYFDRGCDFDETMADIINKSQEWGKGTDLGKALDKIMIQQRKFLNKETFVIIVSDTKTIAADKAAQKLQTMKKQVRDIVWLNTLPKKEWNSTKTIGEFKRSSRIFECNTLAHLEKIMRTQLF